MSSNSYVNKGNKKTVSKKANTGKSAPAQKKPEVRKETSMRFPERKMSQKQAKLILAGIPKHGAMSRSMAKLYLGLTDHVPGEMRQKFYKNDKRRATQKPEAKAA
jgi:hypothetical protein